VREMVDDYLERHEDAFDEFDNPDDIYSDLVEQLDGLEVRAPRVLRQQRSRPVRGWT